jgi:DNA-binding CsgD family transcriptional regulator
MLYPPENIELLQREMAAVEAGDLRARLTVLRRKNGTVLPVLILPQPVYDAELKVLGGVGVIIELATIQTARPAGYAPTEGQLRERLDKIALEIQSIGLAAGGSGPPIPLEHPDLGGLSEREKEVLTQLVSGDRVPDIAAALHISQNTVRNHLKSIFRKVGVGGQGELIQRCEISPARPQRSRACRSGSRRRAAATQAPRRRFRPSKFLRPAAERPRIP